MKENKIENGKREREPEIKKKSEELIKKKKEMNRVNPKKRSSLAIF
jgi:hypothetical protein